jgi:hypothetical protein
MFLAPDLKLTLKYNNRRVENLLQTGAGCNSFKETHAREYRIAASRHRNKLCLRLRGYFGVAQGTTKQLTCHQTHMLYTKRCALKAVTHLDFTIKINRSKIVVSNFYDEKNVKISEKCRRSTFWA